MTRIEYLLKTKEWLQQQLKAKKLYFYDSEFNDLLNDIKEAFGEENDTNAFEEFYSKLVNYYLLSQDDLEVWESYKDSSDLLERDRYKEKGKYTFDETATFHYIEPDAFYNRVWSVTDTASWKKFIKWILECMDDGIEKLTPSQKEEEFKPNVDVNDL